MYCKYCGKEINDHEEICGECMSKSNAYKATASEISSVNQEQQYNSSNQGQYNNQYSNNNQSQYNNPNAKSKIAAGLLGIFLGTLGVHNFYLGYTGKAVAQLLLTVLSCGLLSGVTYIWGLIEGILLLTGSINVDADGNPLRD